MSGFPKRVFVTIEMNDKQKLLLATGRKDANQFADGELVAEYGLLTVGRVKKTAQIVAKKKQS